MARHYATVPADDFLFPPVCAFTGRPDPQSKVRLTKTVMRSSFGALTLLEVCLLVFGHAHLSRASTQSVRVSADRGFAWKAGLVEFFMWSCFLGVVAALIVVFVQAELSQSSAICLGGTILAALCLKCWHYRLLRPVALGEASEYFVEIGFLSEDYAQEFAALNKAFVETR